MRLFVLLYILYIPSIVFAAQPVIVEEGKKQYSLDKYLDFYEDKQGQLSFEEIISPEFETNFQESPGSLGFGYTQSVIWVRVKLVNSLLSSQLMLLEVGFPHIDKITLYRPSAQGTYYQQIAGDLLPFKHRDIKHRFFVFRINLKERQNKLIYLRFQSSGSIKIPLMLYHTFAFQEKDHKEQYILGFYYGFMTVMVLYNLFISFAAQDETHLYYVLYIGFFILAQLTVNGLGFEYLWPNAPEWQKNSNVFYCVTAIMLTMFCKSFLDTKQYTPRLNVVLSFLVVFITLVGGMVFFLPQAIIVRFIGILGIITPILVLITATFCLVGGVRTARFFLGAWLFFLMGIVIYAIGSFGVLPSDLFTEYAIQIGVAMEVLLLSLGLADRINIRLEKYKAQNVFEQQQQQQQQQQLINAYQRFVPEQFLYFLEKKEIVDVRLGDSVSMSMNILFSDIRSFTTLSESMTPEENFNFINSYLKQMGPVIRENNGFIDKYIGDAIMALFKKSADDAVRAGIRMLKKLVTYNEGRQRAGYQPIKIGIGIHTGSLMLGTIGEENRMDGTVISDAVNLASRIEGMTKMYGASILITDETFDHLQDPEIYSMRVVDRVVAKGKSKPVTIWEVLNPDLQKLDEIKEATVKLFEEAITLYSSKQFEDALSRFKECLIKNPEDKAAQIYIERCQYHLEVGGDENWDGTYKLDSK